MAQVLVNNEGGEEGTLLELLQRCQTPFGELTFFGANFATLQLTSIGKRLFRIWLQCPLRDVKAINDR
jgi:DNA mismatch repair protein MSH6